MIDDFKKVFCFRLKQARWARNITTRTLSQETGIGFGLISLYENGKVVPGIKAVTRIADALGVSIDWLIGREEDGRKQTPEQG